MFTEVQHANLHTQKDSSFCSRGGGLPPPQLGSRKLPCNGAGRRRTRVQATRFVLPYTQLTEQIVNP